MKTTNTPAQRHVMIWAFFGLITTLLVLVWLFNGHLANAQSDDTRQPAIAEAQTGTGFTYQGQLILSGPPAEPANGTYTFQFLLYDAAASGTQIGNTQTEAIMVSEGLFTTLLNEAGEFGATAFTGEARYLEIRVSDNGGSSYTTLTPRQSLTAAPYAQSLRPGATISGAVDFGNILKLANNGTGGHGLSVESEGNGIFVDSGGTGLRVFSAGTDGVAVSSAGVNGFSVNTAGGNGVGVGTVGLNGFSVDSATGNGLRVGSAAYGVRVLSATGSGVLVDSAATGVRVLSATGSGVLVDSAATGVRVTSASDTGLRVDSAAGIGLLVDSADMGTRVTNARVGAFVETATQVGFQVNTADIGVYVAGPISSWAGYFTGNVHVAGTLSKSAGAFQIDHPLDPENQYLYHSFVESPDMKNIYDGVVVLDENGMASIQMEAWFDVLNQEFRYQLTPIGAAMPGLYIAQEMADNGFQIAGGEAGMKVSWQVTGIRHDPYAEANRIQVEVDKSAEERGTYLYPELYDQPAEMGLSYQKNLALDEQ